MYSELPCPRCLHIVKLQGVQTKLRLAPAFFQLIRGPINAWVTRSLKVSAIDVLPNLPPIDNCYDNLRVIGGVRCRRCAVRLLKVNRNDRSLSERLPNPDLGLPYPAHSS
jgi:hypothetical protein